MDKEQKLKFPRAPLRVKVKWWIIARLPKCKETSVEGRCYRLRWHTGIHCSGLFRWKGDDIYSGRISDILKAQEQSNEH